jgi:3'-phosphoadenosine 5'-phosphosulfate sulfotransferase (PAPS reductase)/FAD synthetase
MNEINLHDYDLVIINSSGGKDSLCAIWEVCRIADDQVYSRKNIVVSHQDLGESEWEGTKDLVIQQADAFNLEVHVSKRVDKNGREETLLEYVERRGKWPSNKQRYCTSDFKRGPGARVVTRLTKDLGRCSVLYVFGFRSEESPARSKKERFKKNEQLSTKKRSVYDWLPIHDWPLEKVWKTIKENNLPYHKAYDLGMPRLSCCFCIFSPFDALVIAGINNPELLDKYVETEKKIGHSFRDGFEIASVKKAISEGYIPKRIEDWKM